MKTKFPFFLFAISFALFKSSIAQINFPNLNSNFPVNTVVQTYSFNLIGFCSMTSGNDLHVLQASTVSGLNPVATGVNLQFKITSIVSQSVVNCTQTGSVTVGNIFPFTLANPQYTFTSGGTATITGDIMIVGTPTILNEPYECGYFFGITTGSCGNAMYMNGKNKTNASFSLCNVGVSSGIHQNLKTTGISFYPNPAKNNITFSNENYSTLTVQIINTLGQKIKLFKIENGNKTMDISDVAPGTYYVTLTEGNNVVSSEKLIITK